MTTELSTRVLNRTLLERQLLLRRQRRSAADVIEHLVGMQAQNPTDPYFALHARIDNFRPAELEAMLTGRHAARLLLMRATIHLVTARDAVLLPSLMQPVLAGALRSAFRKRLEGVDPVEVAALGRQLVEAQPRTGRELKRLLGERWPEHDAEALTSVVRYLLSLVQVPPRGLWDVDRQMSPTLTTTDVWLDEPQVADPSPDDVVLRYLAAFGPACNADIRTWCRLTGIRAITERLRPGLRTFRDQNGRELFDVPDAPIAASDVPAPPRFLPEFDNVFLAHDDRSRIVDPAVRIGAITTERSVRKLLVDGYVAAEWSIHRDDDDGHGALHVSVRPYRTLSFAEEEAVAAEAAHLVALAAPDHTLDLEFTPVS